MTFKQTLILAAIFFGFPIFVVIVAIDKSIDDKEFAAWTKYAKENACVLQPRTYNARSEIFVCKNGDKYLRQIK